MTRGKLLSLGCLLAALLVPAAASAQPATTYRVTITNLTRSQPITPPVVVTHSIGVHLFIPGQPAAAPLVPLAEEGYTTDLVDVLRGAGGVLDVEVADGPIPPGGSTSVDVTARGTKVFLSAVGMLATTNDAFFGLDGYYLDGHPYARHVDVPAYDAGSEANTEACSDIPGPPCGNHDVRVTDGAEGVVTLHNGIRGVGDLDPAVYDWKNPVVRIDIVRLPGRRPR
jgi:hypothetical protein